MSRKYKLWSERIAAAEKRGRFTNSETDKASNWMTCAIGERHDYPAKWQDLYSLSRDDIPLAEEKLGMLFYCADCIELVTMDIHSLKDFLPEHMEIIEGIKG